MPYNKNEQMSGQFILFEISNSLNIQQMEWYKISFALHGLKQIILSDCSDTDKTLEVKKTLIMLGHELNKLVYANRLFPKDLDEINQHLNQIGRYDKTKKGFRNAEWLFDIHWYTDVKNEFYMPATLDLVAECEWKKVREIGIKAKDRNPKEKNLSAIKFDFQKLLTCNAILRLLVCRLSNLNEADELKAYMEKAVALNSQLANGSHFLTICYIKKGNEMYYMNMFK